VSSTADAVAQALGDITSVDVSVIGVFAGVNADGNQALVNVDDRQLIVPPLGPTWPIVGDRVRLLRAGKMTLMLGTVQQRSTLGRVTDVGSPKCTIEYPPGSGVTDLMSMPKGATPEVGDLVVICWDGEAARTVISIVSSQTDQPKPPDPSGPPVQTTGRQTFTAADSGSFQNGRWWTNQVYASASNRSAFFYGSKIADTIPDEATIDSISVFLSPTRNSGNQPRIGTHGYTSNPGSAPTIGNFVSLANASGWVALPTPFGDLLKTGAQWGVGFDGAGFAIFKGTQQDGQAGALDIAWHL
jgi:hypothetical protein